MSLEHKYKPTRLADYQIGDARANKIIGLYENHTLTRPLLLHGPVGSGKSLLGRLLLEAIHPGANSNELDILSVSKVPALGIINRIELFADMVHNAEDFTGILLDEVDRLKPDAMSALQPLLEKYEEIGKHVQFIFTTNNPQNLPEPILDRCERVEIKLPLARDLIPLALRIAVAEGKSPDPRDIEYLLVQHTRAGHITYRDFYSRLTSYL
jgi:DNA polymerase III delta prime subunit